MQLWLRPDPLLQDLDFEFNPNDADEDDDDEVEEATERSLAVGGGIFNTDNLNPYAYGYNDPVRFNDPDGKCPVCIILVLAGFGVLDAPTQNVQGNQIAKQRMTDMRNQAIVTTLSGGTGGARTGASVVLNAAKNQAQNEARKAAMQRGVANEAKTIKKEGLTKNNKTFTVTDPKTGKPVSTKPDAINSKKVSEIKDTKTVSNTKQIRAQREVAKQTGKKYEVITGKNTKVSKNIPEKEIKRVKYLGPQ